MWPKCLHCRNCDWEDHWESHNDDAPELPRTYVPAKVKKSLKKWHVTEAVQSPAILQMPPAGNDDGDSADSGGDDMALQDFYPVSAFFEDGENVEQADEIDYEGDDGGFAEDEGDDSGFAEDEYDPSD